MLNLSTIEEVNAFIEQNPFSFLYLSQESCSVCKALLPKVDSVLNEYPNLARAYVDTGAVPETVGKFSVFTIPVLLLFIEGKEVMRKARYVSVDDVEATIDKYNRLLNA